VNTTRWGALGTSVVVAVTDPTAMQAAREAVAAEVTALDLACSRFRADSDLSRLNAAGGAPVVVSSLLAQAIRVALRAARLTAGDVDPTVGACMVANGYDRDYASLPPDSPAAAASSVRAGGWGGVLIDDGGLVTLPPGTSLDLGATAKALGADRAAAAARAACGCGVLVSLGGDIATAGDPPALGWPIRITDDHAAVDDAPGQDIVIRSGGLATSSTTVRRWRHGGREMRHIVDPRTGEPVDSPFRTISVAAASCVDANTATTAALVRGAGAVAWLESTGLPARLVGELGEVVHVNGWPAGAEIAA
jgi:thiamine biosynthesis lipoprotein